MSELIFVIEDDPTGGYTARALGRDIFTETDAREELVANVREAVSAYFDCPADGKKSSPIRE